MEISKELAEKLDSLMVSELDERGHELPNPNPMEIPVGFQRPSSLREQIQRILREEVSMEAMENEMETFEESDDFDVDDSFETEAATTRYELVEEEELSLPARPETDVVDPVSDEPEPVDAEGQAQPELPLDSTQT